MLVGGKLGFMQEGLRPPLPESPRPPNPGNPPVPGIGGPPPAPAIAPVMPPVPASLSGPSNQLRVHAAVVRAASATLQRSRCRHRLAWSAPRRFVFSLLLGVLLGLAFVFV